MKSLNLNMEKSFPKDLPIVFLHAHPDDEAFLSAGIIHTLIKQQRKCLIIFTAAAIVKKQMKTKIRQKEAHQASKALGSFETAYLRYCEPKYEGLSDSHPFCKAKANDIVLDIYSTIVSFTSQKVILFSYDKNGGYGNKDHIILHKATHELKSTFLNLLHAVYEVTINRDHLELWLKNIAQNSPEKLPKLSYWRKDFGLKEKEISHVYELSNNEIILKRKALSIHSSQIRENEFPLNLNKKEFREVFGREYFKKVV